MVRVAAGHRVVFQLAEVAGEGHVLGARDVLVAEEQHLVLQQQRADLGHQAGVARSDAQIDIAKLGADGAGQRLDPDRAGQRCWSRPRAGDCVWVAVFMVRLPFMRRQGRLREDRR